MNDNSSVKNLSPMYAGLLRIVLNYSRSNAPDIAEATGEPFTEYDVEKLAKLLGVDLNYKPDGKYEAVRYDSKITGWYEDEFQYTDTNLEKLGPFDNIAEALDAVKSTWNYHADFTRDAYAYWSQENIGVNELRKYLVQPCWPAGLGNKTEDTV